MYSPALDITELILQDIGYGNVENSKGKAAAFEQAKKGAATDGLKRALRTFGNVLGNCLYDKTYLNKIQSMKVAPAKFKEENLHRHSDYAPPPKKEEKEDAVMLKREQQHQTPVRSNAVLRTRTDNLGMSISGEFDDEFDGNLFDDVDMSESQGEEFSFETDAAYGRSTHGATPSRTGPQPNGVPQRPQHPQVPNNTSRAANGASNPAPQRQPQNGNDKPPIHPSVRGPQTPAQQQGNNRADPNKARMQPPTVDIHAAPKPQTASSSNPPPQNQPLRPTPPQVQQQQQQPRPVQTTTTTPTANNPTTNPPLNHHPPVGFVTSRAAELLQHSEDTSSITQLPAFNPNAESPIPEAKRTPGLNRMASKPIKRQDVGAPEPPAPAPAGAGTFTRPGQPQQRGNGNFINPHQDATRRIGMPGGGPQVSGGMNRGAYKPPMKRPPLQDVSNQGAGNAGAGGSGEPDPKKQRLSEGGVSAPGGGVENPAVSSR